MRTYNVEQVAGTWLLRNSKGEAVFTADDLEAAVALARAIARGGYAAVVIMDAQKNSQMFSYGTAPRWSRPF